MASHARTSPCTMLSIGASLKLHHCIQKLWGVLGRAGVHNDLTSSFCNGSASSPQTAAAPGPPASCSPCHSGGRCPLWAAHCVPRQVLPAAPPGNAGPGTPCGCGSRTRTAAIPCRLAACTGCTLVEAPSCAGFSLVLPLTPQAPAPGKPIPSNKCAVCGTWLHAGQMRHNFGVGWCRKKCALATLRAWPGDHRIWGIWSGVCQPATCIHNMMEALSHTCPQAPVQSSRSNIPFADSTGESRSDQDGLVSCR